MDVRVSTAMSSLARVAPNRALCHPNAPLPAAAELVGDSTDCGDVMKPAYDDAVGAGISDAGRVCAPFAVRLKALKRDPMDTVLLTVSDEA